MIPGAEAFPPAGLSCPVVEGRLARWTDEGTTSHGPGRRARSPPAPREGEGRKRPRRGGAQAKPSNTLASWQNRESVRGQSFCLPAVLPPLFQTCAPTGPAARRISRMNPGMTPVIIALSTGAPMACRGGCWRAKRINPLPRLPVARLPGRICRQKCGQISIPESCAGISRYRRGSSLRSGERLFNSPAYGCCWPATRGAPGRSPIWKAAAARRSRSSRKAPRIAGASAAAARLKSSVRSLPVCCETPRCGWRCRSCGTWRRPDPLPEAWRLPR